MNERIVEKFKQIVGQEKTFIQEPMKKHTTFRIGGPADYYLCPDSCQEIADILHICKEEKLPYFILGNGSNLLVSDQGYRGVVIQICKNMNQIQTMDTKIKVQAGCLLSTVSKKAAEQSLTGMEFASGIPGTIGGAVVMNAGAYGGETKDILESVTVLDPEGEIHTLDVDSLKMGYRTSIIKEKEYIVLEAVFGLQLGKKEEIKSEMARLKEQRVTKQPLEFPSAGSTFKRPEGYFAGKLIQDAGLKGYQVGGAMVSEKHCGFVINRGNATAEDVRTLIRDVQKQVYDKFQVELKPEVKFLGEFR